MNDRCHLKKLATDLVLRFIQGHSKDIFVEESGERQQTNSNELDHWDTWAPHLHPKTLRHCEYESHLLIIYPTFSPFIIGVLALEPNNTNSVIDIV